MGEEELKERLPGKSDWLEKFSGLEELLLDEHNAECYDNVRPINFVDSNPEKKYDLVAIGAGAGGLVSAIVCAVGGGKAALIE